jgi:uncharacterized protein YciI
VTIDVDALLASIPAPSQDEMDRGRERARGYTLVFLRTGPAARDDEARNERLQQAHRQHLTRLQLAEKLVLNGPVLIDHELVGVSVYAVDRDEALALAQADPKVQAGYLTVEAVPWLGVASPALEPWVRTI